MIGAGDGPAHKRTKFMITNDRQSTPANAAPPSHPAKPTIEAAPQADFGELSRAAGPNIELRPHIGTDGVALAQDRIWLTTERLGPLVVGYVGHTHGQQIALIHRLTDEERLAVQPAAAAQEPAG